MLNEDFRSKNKYGWASGRVAFVPMSVAELYDSRMDPADKILLMMLRYRSGRNGYTFISWETLCVESGEKRSTLMRRLKKLRELGFLQTESRGYAKTSDKLITDPSELYPDDLIDTHLVGRFFKSNRTSEDTDLLRSVNLKPPGVDNSDIVSSPNDETDADDDLDNSSSLASETPVVPKMGPSVVPPVGLKLDQEKQNLGELDSSRFARRASVPDSEIEKPYGELTTVVPDRSELGEETPLAEDRDADLSRAIALAAQASSSASSASKAASEKRRAKQEREERDGTAETRRQLKEMTKNERHSVGYKFYEWAKAEYERFFPKVRMGKWMATEYSQLKALLDAYGGDVDLVKKAWSFCCEDWDGLSKKLKIVDAAPTIGFLLGLRNRIFPLVQSRETDRQAAERTPLSDKFGEW